MQSTLHKRPARLVLSQQRQPRVRNYEIHTMTQKDNLQSTMSEQDNTNESSMKSIQTVDRAFTVLETISREGALTLADLSKVVKVNKASLLRLLYTLVEDGYLHRDDETGEYSLTLKLYEIAVGSLQSLDHMSQITTTLSELARETGRTVQFSVEDAGELMCLQSMGGTSSFFSVYSEAGHRSPLYCTSAGKAILATYSGAEVAERWDSMNVQPLTEHTICDLQDFQKELAAIRRRQYAIDNEENEYGVFCVGTVVLGANNQVMGAISITGNSLTEEEEAEISSLLISAATSLSRGFGYLNAGLLQL